jgi:ubiquinone/menaquinone biosynthesis C-methylase UbiE
VPNHTPQVTQCQKPSGWFGRLIVRNMNSRHSKLTDWGLSHISVMASDTVLDVGCGGGKTIAKLARLASAGKVFGLDYSEASLSVARKLNEQQIEKGQVEIHEGSVLKLPFQSGTFDLVTAVETHFWWADVPVGVAEIFRVLKPGGTFLIIAEVYKGAQSKMARMVEKTAPRSGIKVLSPDEHRALFDNAGYTNVQVTTDPAKGWICALGEKPSAQP